MLFTFKRDEEGRETMYVGDVCIASMSKLPNGHMIEAVHGTVDGLQESHVWDAIERADEAGFWGGYHCDHCGESDCHTAPRYNEVTVEVTVEVPVAETTATLTLVSDGEDQS